MGDVTVSFQALNSFPADFGKIRKLPEGVDIIEVAYADKPFRHPVMQLWYPVKVFFRNFQPIHSETENPGHDGRKRSPPFARL